MSNASKQELFQEALFRKCAESPEYFFKNYWKIQHPERGAINFELFEAQQNALDVFQNERYVLTLKARQIGWTTVVSAYAFWQAFFHPDRPIVFLSRNEREAIKILAKVKYGYKRLPEWMRHRGPKLLRDNQQEFPLANGSTIESLPSKSDPARGSTVYLVVVDEWAFLENQEEAWASIEPITDVGGRCIGLSTANGWGNFFHQLWVGAEAGTNDFVTIFEPWSSRDDRNDDWYAAKKAKLPSWQLHQEYPSNPDEAFIKSGNPFFDVEKLAEIEPVEPETGYLQGGDVVTFVQNDDGPLSRWEKPIATDSYVLGVDVAEGLDHGDYSSVHVIHYKTHRVVAHWHGHIPPEELAEVVADIGTYYNGALAGVENNNHGLTTCKYLKDFYRYPHIFYSKIIDERQKRATNKIGWTTSRKTKPLMLDELAGALREDSLTVLDRRTIAELRTFVRDEMGKLHGSPFDDRVMSLAIANQMLSYASTYHSQVGQIEQFSMDWWRSTVKQRPQIQRIGAHNTR